MTARSFALLAAAVLCAASPLSAQTLDSALAVFFRNDIEGAVPLFEQLVEENGDDPDLRVWLGDAYLRRDEPLAAISMAEQALAIEPCHAPAYTLLANTWTRWMWTEPDGPDSTWAYARRATECDPSDGNAWLSYWMAGVLRRDTAAERHAQHRLAETGFISGPLMERARWMLRAAPMNAVIITSGDWDYFPMGVAQGVEGLRPDVHLVQQGLLDFPWYVRWIAARTGLAVPREIAELGEDEWMAPEGTSLPRAAMETWWATRHEPGMPPLVVAATADAEWIKPIAWPRLDGPLYSLHPFPADTAEAPVPDVALIAASVRQLDVSRLAGPLVHPTDRSPVRRTDSHPANLMIWFAGYWAVAAYNAGDAEGAREALAWGDQVLATGGVREDQAAWFADVRQQIEVAGQGP